MMSLLLLSVQAIAGPYSWSGNHLGMLIPVDTSIECVRVAQVTVPLEADILGLTTSCSDEPAVELVIDDSPFPLPNGKYRSKLYLCVNAGIEPTQGTCWVGLPDGTEWFSLDHWIYEAWIRRRPLELKEIGDVVPSGGPSVSIYESVVYGPPFSNSVP